MTKGHQQMEDHTEENAQHWKRDLNSAAFKIWDELLHSEGICGSAAEKADLVPTRV